MKGSMALEMVVKFLIILVVAGIVIGLFIRFSGDSKDAVKDLFKPNSTKETGFPKTFQQIRFSSGEVANYIESCYETMTALPEGDQKNIVCYVLMANEPFSGFTDATQISNMLSKEVKPRATFNTTLSKDYVRIAFVDVGNRVVIT